MLRMVSLALLGGLMVMSGGLIGQDKKDDPKKDAPGVKQDKDAPAGKTKGTLPPNWGKIGLTDEQKQDIYKIQGKYNPEIEKLDAKIKELKKSRDAEIKGLLTPDQKKRLEEIVVGKDKDKK